MTVSHGQKMYLAPTAYKDHFVYLGRRYYLTTDKAFISDYGRYGMCPPKGRGFYLLLSKKEFKQAKIGYELQKINWNNALNGNLNREVKTQLSLF